MATPSEIKIAKSYPLYNVEEMEQAARDVGVPFYIACTLFEMESKGRMIMGSDLNGTLTGFPGPFSEGQFDVFYWLVVTKAKPANGYGACQVTHRNYLKDIKSKNIAIWDIYTNMRYGLNILKGHYDNYKSWETAFRLYNGKQSYADTAVRKMGEWKKRLGSTTPTTQFRYHTAVSGDRLSLIAAKYGITTDKLYQANKRGITRADGTPGFMPDANTLEIGDRLLIP